MESPLLSDKLLAKAIVAVLIARRLAGDGSAQPSAEALAGLAAMIGHNWSIYIGFKGGQGVAILYATLLIICWPAVLIASLSTFAMLKLGRIVSLASLTGTVVTVIVLAVYVAWERAPLPYLIFDILAVGIIGLRHKDDIQRFIAWTRTGLWPFMPEYAAGHCASLPAFLHVAVKYRHAKNASARKRSPVRPNQPYCTDW